MKQVVEFDYSVGDRVMLIEIDRPGVVTSLIRDNDGLQYRIVWWDNGSRKSEWLHSFEIRAADDATTKEGSK